VCLYIQDSVSRDHVSLTARAQAEATDFINKTTEFTHNTRPQPGDCETICALDTGECMPRVPFN